MTHVTVDRSLALGLGIYGVLKIWRQKITDLIFELFNAIFVCRAALAIPGLLIIVVGIQEYEMGFCGIANPHQRPVDYIHMCITNFIVSL